MPAGVTRGAGIRPPPLGPEARSEPWAVELVCGSQGVGQSGYRVGCQNLDMTYPTKASDHVQS